MQDQLKQMISEATNTSSEIELSTSPDAMVTEGELADEALEAVAGGVCVGWSFVKACVGWTFVRNGNGLA
jgi:hypothetical protein